MKPLNVLEYREHARRRLPRFVFEYLEGGAEDEVTLRANQRALGALRLVPRILNDVSCRDASISLFGATLPSPLIVGPTGINGLLWPDGDIALARAAARHGAPFVLSTASTSTIEEVREKTDGELWFQLYVVSRALAENLVDRALSAGYGTLVLTVDVPVSGRRERDLRNGFAQPFKLNPRTICDILRHPGWLARTLRAGRPQMRNLASAAADSAQAQAALLSRNMDASFSWTDFARLRDRWPHRLLIKGVLSIEDAEHAVTFGADGIIVSNHGGRQLDGASATIDVLPDIAAVSRVPVLVDGGVRRGSDVVKAVALGATAVMLGRATLYGLAAGGEDGATDVLELLRSEVDRVLALTGCSRIEALRGAHPSVIAKS